MASSVAASLVDAAAPRRTVAATAAAVAAAAIAALRVGPAASTVGGTEEPSASSKRRRKRRSRKKKPEEPAGNFNDGSTVEAPPGEAVASGGLPDHAGEVAPAAETRDDVDLVDGDAAPDPPRTPPKGTSAAPTLSPENLRLHDVAAGSAAKRDAAGSIRSGISIAATPFSQMSFTSHSEGGTHWTTLLAESQRPSKPPFQDFPETARKRSRGKGGAPGKGSRR